MAYSGEGETASLFVPDERGRFGDWARHAADGVATLAATIKRKRGAQSLAKSVSFSDDVVTP